MSEYIGVKNLEVMDCAVNYNAYLSSMVIKHALLSDRILDFGAGIGTFTNVLRNKGYDICCVESDPDQLLRITNTGVSGFLDIENCQDQFDYIFTLNVLEHIEDDQKIITQFSKKIKQGGRLLVYVPAFQILYSSMDKAVGHHRRYLIKNLSSKLLLAGFEIQKAQYVDSVGFFASLFYKYFGNNQGLISVESVKLYDRLVFPFSSMLDYLTNKIFGKNLLIVAVRT